jgi:hypothetical protein
VVVLSRLACFITYSATDPCSNVSNSIVSRNARTLHLCAPTEVPESMAMQQCNNATKLGENPSQRYSSTGRRALCEYFNSSQRVLGN